MRCWMAAVSIILLANPVFAQLTAPFYEQCRLDSIYPAGAQVGQKVSVEFQGVEGGMQHPKTILIEGPPGITVGEIKNLDVNRLTAELIVAPDAVPGRRSVRVVTEQAGLTNLAWFVVGKIPEKLETEPNNNREQAESVTIPVTVNGRIQAPTDVDSYRFEAKAGQKLIVAVMSHALDAHGQYRDYGLADAQLELQDSTGKVVAEAQDTLGLDPVIPFVVPQDGIYSARVQLLGYRGFPQAVYRLSIGELPIPFSAFPAGGQRGQAPVLTLRGWNLGEGITRQVSHEGTPSHYTWVTTGGDSDTGRDVPLHIGDFPESLEKEPNNDRMQANLLPIPSIMNGQFDSESDSDWYRLELATTQPIWLETFAHRHTKLPVDTVIQLYDGEGKLLAEADEGVSDAGYEQWYDFRTPDSRVTLTPKAPGNYFVRVLEGNRGSGPRMIYRLQCKPAEPDFELVQFPDVVPLWGPGSTSSFMVKIERQSQLSEDVEIFVEGLPSGWVSSRHVSTWKSPQNISNYSTKQFLTITAAKEATPGTLAEFRVVGRAKIANKVIERTAYPLSLFYTSDTGFFRMSSTARAAVTRPQGPMLATDTAEISVTKGETVKIPVRILEPGDRKEISLNANVCSNGVAANWGSPQSLPIQDNQVHFPLQIPEEVFPGTYSLVIARSWRADIRTGMPGPSTPAIKLTVLPRQ